MRVLSLDTAGYVCALAVVDLTDDGPFALFHRSKAMARGHAGALAPMAAEAFEVVPAPSITHVVVTRGPGGFTGMRVGLAYARAFALARGLPLVGSSTFEALRFQVGAATPCLIDTRRGDFFYDAITAVALGLPLPNPISVVASAALPAKLPDPFAGSVLVTPTGQNQGMRAPEALGWIEPHVVKLAELARWATPATHPPYPLYVRAPSLGYTSFP